MSLAEEMSRLTQHLAQEYEARVAAVREIAATTADELAKLRSGRDTWGDEQRARLEGFAKDLRGAVGSMLEHMGSAREAMAAEQRERLANYVGALRRDVGALLDDAGSARAEIGAEQRKRLGQYLADLRRDVTAPGGVLRTDYAEARKIWNKLSQTTRRATRPPVKPLAAAKPEKGVKLGGPPVALAEAPAAPPEKPAPPAEEAPRDDLTAIRGIGATMHQRLNEAGIATFAQLAAKSPDQLRQALGDFGRITDVEGWIQQARALAEKG